MHKGLEGDRSQFKTKGCDDNMMQRMLRDSGSKELFLWISNFEGQEMFSMKALLFSFVKS